jgi:hypothetical protein
MTKYFSFFLIKTLAFFLLPFFFIYISSDYLFWDTFWNLFFFIPYQHPPFSDFASIQNAVLSKQHGFNPYYLNPFDVSGHKYMYPSIWMDIFNLLLPHLKYFNFISVYLILLLYFLVIADFFRRFNNISFRITLVFFLFSTSNLLLLERLNIEIIIFCLIYFCLVNKKIIYQFLFFILAIIGKVFPFFSILIFIDNKRIFLLSLFFSFLIIFFYFDEILLMRKNMIEYALIIAYGIPSIIRGLFYYSKEFNFFLNDSNYILWKNIFIILSFLYAFFLFSVSYNIYKKSNTQLLSIEEKFLFSGAGIYLGTFITSSNIDYRLIFLTFVIPYISGLKNNFSKNLFFISFFISINSLIFEGGDRFNLLYPLKAFIVISSKIYIFSYLSFIFGSIFKQRLLFKF